MILLENTKFFIIIRIIIKFIFHILITVVVKYFLSQTMYFHSLFCFSLYKFLSFIKFAFKYEENQIRVYFSFCVGAKHSRRPSFISKVY